MDEEIFGTLPLFQMTVDSDFGGGADSIQSYMGFNFDLTALK